MVFPLTGVSNCYVFKSRLQEYAQKAGLPTPVYETLKEGPSHEPCFRSTVIVDHVRYDSLPGFFNRKAAEQSAAEIALMEILKSGNVNDSISHPVHETGLCKNLLQEYAQKMNYAIPSYMCRKDEMQGKTPHFSCTIEIGGIHYIGAAAKTKKEAEIKAARTALLAIQSSASEAKLNGTSQLTVQPCKKKGAEAETPRAETAKPLKRKKGGFKKKWSNKKKFRRNKDDQANSTATEQNVNNSDNSYMWDTKEDAQNKPETNQDVSVATKDISSQNGEFSLKTGQNEQVISSTGSLSKVTKIDATEGETAVGGKDLCSKNNRDGLDQIEDVRKVSAGEVVSQRVDMEVEACQEAH